MARRMGLAVVPVIGWQHGSYYEPPTADEMRERVTMYCRVYDVPPWISVYGPPRPRLARVRWWLRHVAPWLVWGRT